MQMKPRTLPASTAVIETCEQEAIHTPNVIQPHGAVLVADIESHRITHASANLEAFLDRTPEWAIGRQLQEVIGKAAFPVIEPEAPETAASVGTVLTVPGSDGRKINVRAHRTGPHLFIDLQPVADPTAASPLPALHAVLESLMFARTCGELCNTAVKGLRTASGFDRVMAYRFGTSGEGNIIAESKIDSLEPYIGMTYPAADVPPQARALFLRSRVGAIADFSYTPVPLLVDPAVDDSVPIDMTRSTLRGISPIHCQYMRNMNVGASMSIAIVHHDRLWGMLVCHHNSPRIVGPELRSVAKLLGQVLSLLIGSLGEAEAYVERLARQGSLQSIVDAIGNGQPLLHGLTQDPPALLELVGAGGVIVRLAGQMFRFGALPPPAAQAELLTQIAALANGNTFALDDIGLRYPDLQGCTDAGSGALFMEFGLGHDDAILWFRPEARRNIVWGGDPSSHHIIDPATRRLTPRASFAAWNEITRGRSEPWTDADLALAADLRTAIEVEIAARASAGLAKLRHFDPLTGLANRRRLEERLQEAATRSEDSSKLGVLFLDLDHFKAINDSMGHAAGDMLLVQAAERLLAATGANHLVARLGGDEFVILAFGLCVTEMAELAETIRRALELPFNLHRHSTHVSVSIGLAMSNEVGSLDIVQAADMAMYEAKQHGGNRVATFEQSLHDQAVRKFELDHDLRQAVNETDQFMLVYQPLFDIRNPGLNLLGFEALLRWRHPRLGWVAPDIFIPIAEKSGIIVRLGDWIIRTATRQAKAMRAANPNINLVMTINVSVLQLAEPGFAMRMATILADVAVPASAICLEVTESMISNKAIAAVLGDVRALGVRIAIDDFGTGYSSLACLRLLPADIVKLDCSFLDDSETDARDFGFVGAVVALIHAAGMTVIQEGVETAAQCVKTQTSGADMVQGFMFGRPLLAPDAMKLARKGHIIATPSGGAIKTPIVVHSQTGGRASFH